MKRRLVFLGVGVLVLCVAAGTIAFFQVGYFLESPSQQPEKPTSLSRWLVGVVTVSTKRLSFTSRASRPTCC